MLPAKCIDRPDAVEEYLCRPFEAAMRKPVRMDDETMKTLTTLLLGPATTVDQLKEKPLLVKIIEDRFKAMSVKMNDGKLLLFVAILSKGTPGIAIMLVTYLQYWAKKNGAKELDLKIFCESIFPFGFLTDEVFLALWDGQKLEIGGNLLDHEIPFESIQFT